MTKSLFDEYPRTLKEDEPLFIDKWKILHVIGAGGMGKVFEGISQDGTKSAIKIIQPQFINQELLNRFGKEIDAMKMLNSPYVARILHSNIEHNPPFMAIELVHGKTLAKIIRNEKPISESHWKLIAKQLMLGLEEIGARNLVHRDIKPANIMHLTDKVEIKIIDFGVVRSENRTNRLNQTVLAGTMSYMSPEQLNFEVPTHKSDLFSSGITLAQLGTGRHPFAPINNKETIEQRIKESEPNLSGLSNFQKMICNALLQKNPSKRPFAHHVIEECFPRVIGNAIASPAPKKPVAKPAAKKPAAKKVFSEKDPVLDGLIGEIESAKLKPNVLVNRVKFSKNLRAKPVSKQAKEIQLLTEVLKIFLTNHSNNVYHIEFFSKVFNSKIYFQGYTDINSNLLAEAMSDQFLNRKFSESDHSRMTVNGWNEPCDGNPNYFILLDKNEGAISKISRRISMALFLVYGGSSLSEIYLSSISNETRKEILDSTGVLVNDDGSFLTRESQKIKSAPDQYLKWQVIGFIGKNSSDDYVLQKVMARHIENDRVYVRTKKPSWLFTGVVSNPFLPEAFKVGDYMPPNLKGLVFNKKIISLFDKSKKVGTELTFETIRPFIDFVPNLSDKYLDEEKANPLTNQMIKLAEMTSKVHAFSDFSSIIFEEGLSLFTLISSDVDDDLVLGLFAKHPVTNKFYGRKNGEWKLLFESPIRYGFAVTFVTKEFIDLYDRRSKLPNKPIRWEEIERLGFLYE